MSLNMSGILASSSMSQTKRQLIDTFPNTIMVGRGHMLDGTIRPLNRPMLMDGIEYSVRVKTRVVAND